MWMRLKKLIYQLGIRPKAGSIFYSPSLAWEYIFKDYNLADAFEEGYAKSLRIISWGPDVNGFPGTSIEVIDRENPAENQ